MGMVMQVISNIANIVGIAGSFPSGGEVCVYYYGAMFLSIFFCEAHPLQLAF